MGISLWNAGDFIDSTAFNSSNVDYKLVGGLEHLDYFSIYWEFHHPNWLSYFSEGWLNHQPVSVYASVLFNDFRGWTGIFLYT